MRYSKMPLEAARREARLEQLRERLASSDPALVPFAIQWAEDMERRMAAEHKHVRQVASAALAAQGGGSLRKVQIVRIIKILMEVWELGQSLRRWAHENGYPTS